MNPLSINSFLKRRGATVAGVFSLALTSVLLLCGAGSVPVNNLLPQGTMQGDLDAGGHNLTNAATVTAATVNATSLKVSGNFTSSSNLPYQLGPTNHNFVFAGDSLTVGAGRPGQHGLPIVPRGGSIARPWLVRQRDGL